MERLGRHRRRLTSACQVNAEHGQISADLIKVLSVISWDAPDFMVAQARGRRFPGRRRSSKANSPTRIQMLAIQVGWRQSKWAISDCHLPVGCIRLSENPDACAVGERARRQPRRWLPHPRNARGSRAPESGSIHGYRRRRETSGRVPCASVARSGPCRESGLHDPRWQ